MGSTVHYGYSDASGEYYITIAGSCDGCGKCLAACPEAVLELIVNDYDETVAAVTEHWRRDLSTACAPCKPIGEQPALPCQQACPPHAITHSW